MRDLIGQYKNKIIFGIIMLIILAPIYFSFVNSRREEIIRNSQCINLRTQEVCAKNDKCSWDKNNTLCCDKAEYATTNSLGKKICCPKGKVCE